ncbi:MAG: hypothetical protein C4562_02270 [Actinobacteria bacterium]|nr:MAG: hypothetical protein C4562_02270 [Actinomycetota bacterium]
MIFLRKRHQNLIKILALLIVAFFTLASIALATPLSEKKEKLEEIEQEVSDLDEQISQADERYNQAQNKLDSIQENIGYNQDKLEETKVELAHNKQVLNDRVKGMYTSDSSSTLLEFALATASFQDFLTNLDFLQRIGRQDAQVVGNIKTSKRKLETAQQELANAEEEQKDAVAQIANEKAGIEKTLEKRKDIMAGVEDEIAALEEEQNRAAALAAVQTYNPSPDPAAVPQIPTHPPAGGVVEVAYAQQGKPYVWAGSGPNSFDCSGLVMYCYAQVGISLPHSSYAQYNVGSFVPQEALQPGDIVFFGSPPHHVGIYIGSGLMIHAPSSGDVVKISSAFRGDYSGARRP